MTASAIRAGRDPASASDTVSTVSMPSRRQVPITRTAISPRLATSTRRNPRGPLTQCPASRQRGAPQSGWSELIEDRR